MSENITVNLTHEEVEVTIHILKKIAQVEASTQQLLSSLYNIDRIKAAKQTLRKLQKGQNLRVRHIEKTQSSERNLSTPDKLEITRLMNENKVLSEKVGESEKLKRNLQKAANKKNYSQIDTILNMEDYSFENEE